MSNEKTYLPVTEDGMSLARLHARLGEIIKKNEESGWAGRNDLPIVVQVRQVSSPKGRNRGSRYFPVELATSSMLSFGNVKGSCMTITADEVNEVAKPKKQKRVTVKQIEAILNENRLKPINLKNFSSGKQIEVYREESGIYLGSVYYEQNLSDLSAEEWAEKLAKRVPLKT